MEIKKYINKIVEEGSDEDMDKLSDIMIDLFYDLKRYDEEKAHKYKMCLYKMAYGETISEDMARDIIEDMKPEGEHWTLEQTNQVKNQYGFMDINEIDFWLVMNMAYNDYKEIFRDNLDMYARFSYAFINDPDAKQGKVFKYFT
jgi:hypothetical protein